MGIFMEIWDSGIAIIIGTKAELIKCMPIMLELQKQNKKYWFIHTGQHFLGNACDEFGIKKPDFILSKEPEKGTKFWSKINRNSLSWCFSMIPKIRDVLWKINPRYVIYHGDTMSTAVASISSSRLLNFGKKWKNVHLEAGLRSGSLFDPFPEEISRRISDFFSNILLAVSDSTEKNLSRYRDKRIIKAGNTIVDSALLIYDKSKKAGYKKPSGEYALINLHRHENLRNRERMRDIIRILKEVKIKAIWPMHENTSEFLEKYGLMNEVNSMKNISVTGLVDYANFIFLLANCKYLVMDGGSIQEESLIFGKPCVILRKRTERQEGLSTGINFLTRLDVEKSRRIIREIENNNIKIKKFKNPYGEHGVSKKIIEKLK
jgi:UDP-N-acetylglucosamine 2-epimerase (non-hydrolysing)